MRPMACAGVWPFRKFQIPAGVSGLPVPELPLIPEAVSNASEAQQGMGAASNTW